MINWARGGDWRVSGPGVPTNNCEPGAPEYYLLNIAPGRTRPGPGLNDLNLVGFIRILSEYGQG